VGLTAANAADHFHPDRLRPSLLPRKVSTARDETVAKNLDEMSFSGELLAANKLLELHSSAKGRV
jgi:hypothetical protein